MALVCVGLIRKSLVIILKLQHTHFVSVCNPERTIEVLYNIQKYEFRICFYLVLCSDFTLWHNKLKALKDDYILLTNYNNSSTIQTERADYVVIIVLYIILINKSGRVLGKRHVMLDHFVLRKLILFIVMESICLHCDEREVKLNSFTVKGT